MREILFRGKRLDNGEWVEGCLLIFYEDDRDRYYIATKENRIAEIDPVTVDQYTGLKDKHGKRIFEGDLLKPFDDDIDKMVVEFHNGQFLLCLYGERGYMAEYGWEEEGNYGCFEAESLYSYGDDIQVIGNIHDPELLGGEGDD